MIKLARRKEDQAASLLRQWRERVENQRQQLLELENYQESYHRWPQGAQSVQSLITERAFFTQLSGVVDEQRQRLSQMEHQYQLYVNHWQGLHKRRQLLDEHRDRVALDETQRLDKQWDKLCDELAITAFSAKK
ncbi:flagellar FliJ family protein [Simiduia curdlanivorans]|uniref:Flagellar FliJ protein n=1 Tax=Simiduia curdlanivorans TaxID=1492769 RepID=A0ABV8V9F1_9GAMM|nr:flagellar FliJ family protein [Simiduia curdlanivorans]MDN3639859.1 flagellar FliJ family protein [Simiduia curdlanivorans]